MHLITIGLATSQSISGLTASKFRLQSIIVATVILATDIYVSTTMDLPTSRPSNPSPQSIYVGTAIARPLILVIYDIVLAFLVYITATGRFIFFPFLASAAAPEDPEELLAQTDKLMNETALSLQMVHMKLRGLNVARNAVMRDEALKTADTRYWETVRMVEGEDGTQTDEAVFEDEEVQAAMARAFGSGNVDVARMRKEAKGFVQNVTRGLGQSGQSQGSNR